MCTLNLIWLRARSSVSARLALLEKTLAVLADDHALSNICGADAAYARGDVVRGVGAVRALRR